MAIKKVSKRLASSDRTQSAYRNLCWAEDFYKTYTCHPFITKKQAYKKFTAAKSYYRNSVKNDKIKLKVKKLMNELKPKKKNV